MNQEFLPTTSGMTEVLNKSEIDMQIATAHRFPRSMKQFRTDVTDMVTLSVDVASECMYALPRGDKTIEGPSARFAEIVLSAWGNTRASARVTEDKGAFIVAVGLFHDLQRNVAIAYEVQRRVTDRFGNRYSDDMIATTANAACSIAMRNAILKGIPKAVWTEMYDAARETALGNVETLPNRRERVFAKFARYGISQEQIFTFLKVKGCDDIGQTQLLTLWGVFTAIREGDITPENAFKPVTVATLSENELDELVGSIQTAQSLEVLEAERKRTSAIAAKTQDKNAIKRINAEAAKRKKELNHATD